MAMTPNQVILHDDLRRYKKNKVASTLALLAIVFNCLYFCLLYSFRGSFFSDWRLGISVILTLIVLLISFLCSEGIKNYDKKYAIPLCVLAVVQFIRIFGLPLQALRSDISQGVANGINSSAALSMRYFGIDLSSSAAYTIMVIWLAASAACLIASAVIGYINSVRLEIFNKKVASGEIVVEKVYAEMDKESEVAAVEESKEQVASAEEVE